MTEYCEGYENVYQKIKDAKFGDIQDNIPKRFIRMIYLFVIQISSAFSIAHDCNLTHGAFDLTQVLCDYNLSNFKVTNFRPWLVNGRSFSFNSECETSNFRNLSKEDKVKIAKHQDIYDFGVSVYELMLAKTASKF